jgi:hypothetical protein
MLPGWHRLFASQQPSAQLAALHTHAPATHARPVPHAAASPQLQEPFLQPSATVELQSEQLPPAVPHVAKLALLQQPSAQPLALHVHSPFTHCWPTPQAEPVPQRQLPAAH